MFFFFSKAWNKACGEHKLKIFWCFILDFKKMIAIKWLNGTTEVVRDTKHKQKKLIYTLDAFTASLCFFKLLQTILTQIFRENVFI